MAALRKNETPLLFKLFKKENFWIFRQLHGFVVLYFKFMIDFIDFHLNKVLQSYKYAATQNYCGSKIRIS